MARRVEAVLRTRSLGLVVGFYFGGFCGGGIDASLESVRVSNGLTDHILGFGLRLIVARKNCRRCFRAFLLPRK